MGFKISFREQCYNLSGVRFSRIHGSRRVVLPKLHIQKWHFEDRGVFNVATVDTDGVLE